MKNISSNNVSHFQDCAEHIKPTEANKCFCNTGEPIDRPKFDLCADSAADKRDLDKECQLQTRLGDVVEFECHIFALMRVNLRRKPKERCQQQKLNTRLLPPGVVHHNKILKHPRVKHEHHGNEERSGQ
ncbi:unnamed protein product [Phytophthora lilii]|uniref:Unnamed protein product n=1 Tax=Phytophthora lilii TaxID=2077276 RepID=A0A9W6XJ51_9STRA|nr:unnamed protein product [Phytophthora lilii]